MKPRARCKYKHTVSRNENASFNLNARKQWHDQGTIGDVDIGCQQIGSFIKATDKPFMELERSNEDRTGQ